MMHRGLEFFGRLLASGGLVLLGLANLLCAAGLVVAWRERVVTLGVFCAAFNVISLGGWILRGRLGAFSGSLYFPRGHDDRPQPVYGPALALKTQGEYAQALQAMLAIAKEYPDQARPLLEALDMLAGPLQDPAQFHAVYQWGIQRLREPAERDKLSRGYREMGVDLPGPE